MKLPGWTTELRLMGQAYWGGAYPPFVYGRGGEDDWLPVFYFHDTAPDSFAEQLRFLQDNGYEAIDCDAAVRALAGPHRDVHRRVVLTVDDGLASLYGIIYPLAREYGTRIVAYVVPGWIGRPGYITWEQCAEMHESGWVDIQSHSHGHRREITGMTPRGWRRLSAMSPPVWQLAGLEAGHLDMAIAQFPVLEGGSLFDTDRAVRLPPAFWRDWQAATADASDAEDELSAAFAHLRERYAEQILHLGVDELHAAMIEELDASRTALEAALPGHTVRHFAFPWSDNNAAAWRALRDAGFASAAVGLPMPDEPDVPADGPRRLFRVSGDFLRCLPGARHRGFSRVVIQKVMRRARETVLG